MNQLFMSLTIKLNLQMHRWW